MTAAALIFLVTYLVIGIQRIPRLHLGRPAGALLGAVAMVAFGVVTFDEAKRAIDLAAFSTLTGNFTVIGSVANVIVFETAKREGVDVAFFEYLRVGLPVTMLTLLAAWIWI